jgi:hypothetical protein
MKPEPRIIASHKIERFEDNSVTAISALRSILRHLFEFRNEWNAAPLAAPANEPGAEPRRFCFLTPNEFVRLQQVFK